MKKRRGTAKEEKQAVKFIYRNVYYDMCPMASKNIMLAVPEQIFKILKNEKENLGYSSVQELILEALREKYFKNKKEKESRGRPKKIDETEILSRKRIFSKRGGPFPL